MQELQSPEAQKIDALKAQANGALDEYSLSPSLRSLATTGLRKRGSIHSERSQSDSKASSTALKYWLKEQLYKARIEVPYRPHTFFVPRSVLQDLITVSAVASDIQARFPDVDEIQATLVAERVCAYARQLYAILAYVRKAEDITLLLEEGITDEDLPLFRKPNAHSVFALYRNDGNTIKTCETWRANHLEKFDRIQWWMIAPVFRLNEDLYRLDDKTVLPFIPLGHSSNELEHKQGGYSEVYPVRIHPAHHEFWHSTGRVVSIN